MKNKKVYIITLLISTALLLPSFFYNSSQSTDYCPLLSVLSGIGCSGIAAAIMAIFLEYTNNKREQEKLKRAKTLYFRQIYDQLVMMIERTLWFYERLPESSFNWDLPDYVYSTLKYMVGMSTRFPERSLTYAEAINMLKDVGEKFNLDNIKQLGENEKHKINRLFQIVAASASYLLNEANSIKDNKLILDVEEYMGLDQNKSIMFDISFFVTLMAKPDKNYQAAVESLIRVTEQIRKIGMYPRNDIRVGLHGSFPMNEI